MIVKYKKEYDLLIRKLTPKIKKSLRNISGIYAIYWGGVCLYVGASVRIGERISIAFNYKSCQNLILDTFLKYLKSKNIPIHARIFLYNLEELKEAEQYYINTLNSRCNVRNLPYVFQLHENGKQTTNAKWLMMQKEA